MKIQYRPEIDGLRAIAVISVILYHTEITFFGFRLFQGGFIGVDIFFVISGYLITSIILKELVTNKSFSFKNFYERRMRRILPVLVFVIFSSLFFAWLYLLPNNFYDFSKSILYSLGFSSNFYFYESGQQYGAESGWLKPFLHTWSLSVEEQFYIIFPMILLIVFKYFKKKLIYIFIVIFLISLLFAEYTSRINLSKSFYYIHTRMWELLAGSILAYFEIIKGYRSKNQVLNLILSVLGLLLIAHSIIFFNDNTLHPSFITLSPIIGVCLIIWFSNQDNFQTKILSSKLLVSIGLISYSLYLWHYPIFSFAKIRYLFDSNINIKIIFVLVVIILSIISYYYIERPFRNKNNNFKNIFLFICLSYLIIISFIFIVFNNKFLFFDKKFLEFNVLKNTETYWNKCKISEINDNHYCKIGEYNNKAFLIGDSHLIPLIQDLGKKLNEKKYELNILLQPSFIYRRKLGYDKRVNFLKNIKNSIFIFGGFYQRERPDELNSLYTYYKKDFDIFKKNNNKIIFLTPIPKVNFNPEKDLYLIINNKIKNVFVFKKDAIVSEKFAISFINKFENISIIDLKKVFCDENKCYAVNSDKEILKSDLDHPSLKSAEMINDLIINEIQTKK